MANAVVVVLEPTTPDAMALASLRLVRGAVQHSDAWFLVLMHLASPA
jgi:hypothetical protein